MNVKTTALLALLLASLVCALVVFKPDPQKALDAPKPAAGPLVRRDVLEKKPTDITKVVVEQKGKEPIVFEKSKNENPAAATAWRMTAPLDIPVPIHEAERFGRELSRMQFEMSYQKGDGGRPDDAALGLSPPEAVVTLHDASGDTVVIEVGKPASENETYVRVKGSDAVVVAQSNLRRLFKPRPLEYRDTQTFNYSPENVTRLEIVDRSNSASSTNYVFNRDGSKWMMESPVSTQATPKVDEMVRALSRLRVSQWYDQGKEKLAAMNLDPSPLTVRMTLDEPEILDKKDVEKEGSEEAPDPPAPPKTRRSVRELHVSNRAPIGDDGKLFARIDDDYMVATILKTTVDKLKPEISQLRDMSVTPVAIDKVTRIDVTAGGTSGALLQKDNLWHLESGDAAADDAAVKELLKAIDGMNAIEFVDAAPGDLAKFGLDAPQATLRLSGAGLDQPEQLAVGAYTDPAAKRVVFVRRGESQSIAKVRVDEAAPLLRPASAYQDRTLVKLPPDKIEQIKVTRMHQGAQEEFSFSRNGGAWSMTAPVPAAVRDDRMQKLAELLGNLKATNVIAAAEGSQFGLEKPAVSIEIIGGGSALPDPESDDPGVPGGASKSSTRLDFAQHQGKIYAKRADLQTIYAVDQELFNILTAEYRKPEIFNFEVAKVKRFEIRDGESRHAFAKSGSVWSYEPEPALPLEAKKVDNLLLQIKDLKTERYVAYNSDEVSALGLKNPLREIRVELEEGAPLVLAVSEKQADRYSDKGHYATLQGSNDVFLLTTDMLKRTDIALAELEKR